MTSFFHVEDLELRLGRFRLGPVSLGLDRKDYLVLLGPTGCGKTTLIRCIVGAHSADSIVLDGTDISALPPERRGLGYVAQVTDLFPHLTVEGNVAFGLKYAGLDAHERRERLKKYLDLFGLQDMKDRDAATLSGGESRKVSLARSLAVEPKLLLLDEPLGMLDHNERSDMVDVLRMVHEELQTTTVHVTHDRHEAWSIAQRCAVMNEGKILETGTVAKLFRAPESRFVAEFLGGANIFPARFDRAEARTSWGKVPLESPPRMEKGWILLRPEQISVTTTRVEDGVQGTVRAVRDFGEYIELEVAVGDADRLIVHASIEGAAGMEPGRVVFLTWPAGAAHAFEERDGA
ncbi:MAG: ABC transporter ATP-binding protein [Planctomycetota bacterium]|jgi:ABC-type Fe3+/spermidine/putrescine transport system ATPase subunit